MRRGRYFAKRCSLAQLEFGLQLLARLELTGLDLFAKIFGYLTVHRRSHQASSRSCQAPDRRVILLIQIIHVVQPVRIAGLGWFKPNTSVIAHKEVPEIGMVRMAGSIGSILTVDFWAQGRRDSFGCEQ